MEQAAAATTNNAGGGGGAGASTSTSSTAASGRWSPAEDVALKATLRLHFQDLASTIRPRDWYTRHSLYWWLSQHYFPCTRTLFGERTCSLLGLVSQVHRTIISGLASFVEANNVIKAAVQGTDKQKLTIGAANYLLLMAWKHCSLQSPSVMVDAGLTFPLFDIIYDEPVKDANASSNDQAQEVCAFSEEEFVGITSIEQIGRYRLEWTDEGYEGFQYWVQPKHFSELVEAGPLPTSLTSPDGSAKPNAQQSQAVDDVPRERRDVALHALIQLHQDAERFMSHKRESVSRDVAGSNDTNHHGDEDEEEDEGEDYIEGLMGHSTKITTRSNKRRKKNHSYGSSSRDERGSSSSSSSASSSSSSSSTSSSKANNMASRNSEEEILTIGGDEEAVDEEVEKAREELLLAQARQVEVELHLIKARAAVRQARAQLKIAQAKSKSAD